MLLSKGAIIRLFGGGTWTGGDIAIDDGVILDVPTGQTPNGDYVITANSVPSGCGSTLQYDFVFDTGESLFKAVEHGSNTKFAENADIIVLLGLLGVTVEKHR